MTLQQQEVKNKKMKHKFEIDERDIKDVKKNLRKDVDLLKKE